MGNPYDILWSATDFRETIQENLNNLGSNQRNVLSSTEELAIGWFERRHAGIQSAVTTSQPICGAESPMSAISEYQTWAAGAFGRIIADGLAYQKYLTTIAGLIGGPLSPSFKEDAATPSPATKHKQSKAA